MLDVTRAYGLDFLFPLRDLAVGASLRRGGEFARPEMEVISTLLARSGGTYIDVGANIGSIVLPVAARNRACRTIAIEGNRHLATILSANTLLNRLDNVDVHHAAAGAAAGLTRFPTPPLDSAFNFGGLSLAEAAQAAMPHEDVRVCTLDAIAPGDTHIVKLDVEGFEGAVLDGAGELLRRRAASWIVEHKRGDARSIAVATRFVDAGYRLFWLWAPFVSPAAAKRSDGPFVVGDLNILAMPSGEPPLSMMEATEQLDAPPTTIDNFPYLKHYGY